MKIRTALQQYITLKKSLGFRFETPSRILRAFGRALGDVNMGDVKPKAVKAYLDGKGPLTRTWALKWRTLRCFYRFAQARRWIRRSPLPQVAPKVAESFTPYIYTADELRGLLTAITPTRAAGLTPSTVRALLLLLYGAGLRISEALQLDDADVNLKDGLVNVRCSKFYKARLVPIGLRLTQELMEYASGRPEASSSHQRFFRSKRGAPISCCAADRIFRAVRAAAGISRSDGAYYQPRLHDLRHTAAVHRLIASYRKGVDLQSMLLGLSVYLGHADLNATQRYLTVTPELRGKACKRFARYAGRIS